MTTKTTAQWVASPTIRGTIRVPPDVRGAAYVVAVIRALLLENRLPAKDDYRDMVATLTPAVTTIKAEAEALVSDRAWLATATEKGERWARGFVPSALARLGPQIIGVRDIFREWRDPVHRQGFKAVDVRAGEFAHRWLFGSETGRMVLWALATVDAAGVDPLAVDWQRAERSSIWTAAYGDFKTRLSRRQHKHLMDNLKSQGWTSLKDSELLSSAADWVECFHVAGGIADWLRAKGQDPGPSYNSRTIISKRFKSFDEALGIRRKPGRPSRVGTSV
jgi:hypothetical protein